VPQLYAPHPLYLFGGLTALIVLSAAIHKYWLKQNLLAEEAMCDEHNTPNNDSGELPQTIATPAS
jgi:hypothetical protein